MMYCIHLIKIYMFVSYDPLHTIYISPVSVVRMCV